MSISPMNFNGMIQSTNEVSHAKVQEDQRSHIQQANVSVEVNRKQEELAHQVNDPEQSREQEYRYDRGGNGAGYRGSQNKKKKKEKESKGDGTVTKKPMTSFDIRI